MQESAASRRASGRRQRNSARRSSGPPRYCTGARRYSAERAAVHHSAGLHGKSATLRTSAAATAIVRRGVGWKHHSAMPKFGLVTKSAAASGPVSAAAVCSGAHCAATTA